ncbi:sensor histidine kinase [Paenibacillus sp. BC26]|uniref:sensor histidine kinase n=1 Tax=Paenibacillus sp. BC26 TaxID=1881032 RepID=UPI0008E65401|nr:sensor histidine kinase [Paenibacillus sp. BC26]SFT04955.1 two-component system, sensor histidine kinase YesM [Paenibacillus sp. BC26]
MRVFKQFNAGIFTKLLLAFLIVIIPIFSISIYIIQSAEKNMREELSQSVVNNVQFYMSSFESEMARIIQINKELIFNEDFQKIRTIAAEMDDYTRVQTILKVKDRLNLLKTSSLYVENVKVYIPSMERGIFSNSYDNHIPLDELNALKMSGRTGGKITYWEKGLFLSEVYPDPFQKLPLTIALGVDLSTKKLQESLRQIVDMDGAGASFINVKQNWSFSDGKHDQLLPEIKAFLNNPDLKGRAIDQSNISIKGKNYVITYGYSKLLDTYLVVYIPADEVLGPLDKYRKFLWLLSILSIVIIVAFSYWIFRLIHRPLKRLVSSFRKVERGDLQIELDHNYSDEFKYLYGQFNVMVSQLNKLIGEVYEERIRSQQAELKQLQSQINPHFLYNSFFMLQGLVRMRDVQTAEHLLQHLGDYFKFITRTGNETIPLDQEIHHSKSYTEIQTLRFSRQIRVEWEELPEAFRRLPVPRLILQPVIENAYVHGLEDKVSNGLLSIRFAIEDEDLLIQVEDNGENISEAALEELRHRMQHDLTKESTGILNVHRRLQLRYGEHYGLAVSRGAEGGVLVEMRLTTKGAEKNV